MVEEALVIRLPFVSRTRFDLAVHNIAEMRALYHADVAYYRAQLEQERTAHAETRARMHELRAAGADPAPPQYNQPTQEQFGPLTRAALHDAGVGQTGPVKRAMTAKAQVIWLEHRADPNRDEMTAIAVRQGETVSR